MPGRRGADRRRHGKELPWDGRTVGEIQVRGPWIASAYYREDRPPRSSPTAGSARATSLDRPPGLHKDRRPDQGPRQVRRRVDLERRARGDIMGHPEVAEAAVIACRTRGGASALSPASSCAPTPGAGDSRRDARTFSPRASPSGGCPTTSCSSTRCRRRRVGQVRQEGPARAVQELRGRLSRHQLHEPGEARELSRDPRCREDRRSNRPGAKIPKNE